MQRLRLAGRAVVRVSEQDFYLPSPLLTKEGNLYGSPLLTKGGIPLGPTDVLPRIHTISGSAGVCFWLIGLLPRIGPG